MTIHRLKILTLGVALATLPSVLHAQELADGTAWVSDELTTFVRSGPTDGYRIIGTLTAGEPVTVLETSGDYSRVEDSEGDIVWVLSSELQDDPSAQKRLPELEARVSALTEELSGINDTWENRTASMTDTLELREEHIAELEARNQALEEETAQSRATIRELQARLDTQEEDLLMRYFIYGGGVAGAGLLVGLIVPHLPRRRRKRDRWF
ncbi:peptide-binding protein [Halomonas aestuarii]|uniref:Peptide-binding protein n=1 Tax=Halomonas aestuarii TaxID=1897729 RepID=A0A1J0VK78_9GAMM|nr:TIGR04211 family SH3 domain-containing protein [Halomonas aestuarii]APE32435.1 peptide-binding protein [Halomonas aestuarii]